MATIEERLREVKEQLKKIESELKGIEQKPVAGWRKHKESSKNLAYSDGECFVYGFDMLGEWFDYGGIKIGVGVEISSELIFYTSDPADPKEVEQRLIEEAERITGITYVWYKFTKDNRLLASNSNLPAEKDIIELFNNGVWAEIIEEPLTLNGKEVDYDESDDTITCNDFTFNIDTVRSAFEVCDIFECSIEDLKQLLTKIEERENR